LVDGLGHARVALANRQSGARARIAERGETCRSEKRIPIMTRIAITGAAGFIGSNFVHLTLKAHPSWELVLIDQLTYAGNLRNLESALGNGRLRFVRLDICDAAIADTLAGCDYV